MILRRAEPGIFSAATLEAGTETGTGTETGAGFVSSTGTGAVSSTEADTGAAAVSRLDWEGEEEGKKKGRGDFCH
jgi:hypothetical protein